MSWNKGRRIDAVDAWASAFQRLFRNRRINGGCWEWTGATNRHGYGVINIGGSDGRVHLVHRATALLYGFPAELNALHKCHNRLCFNPEHLYSGTQVENMRDAYLAGSRGKMTAARVREFRRLYATGQYTQRALAKHYNISYATANKIALQRIWQYAN